MRSAFLVSLPAAALVGTEASAAAFTIATLMLIPFVGLAASTLPSAIVGGLAGLGSGALFARHAVRVAAWPEEN